MCLHDTYSRVRIGKYLSDKIPVQNGLKQADALSPLFFLNLLWNEPLGVQIFGNNTNRSDLYARRD
jgi:hypothetical protein